MKNMELLLKIKALAEKGVGGEKESAQRMLEKACDRLGIDPSSLDGEEENIFFFVVNKKVPEDIFFQVAFKTLDRHRVDMYKVDNKTGFKCTKVQAVEFDCAYVFYCSAFLEDLKTFTNAFCLKNRLFPGSPDTNNLTKPLPDKEYMKMKRMADGLEAKQFRKQIKE